MARYEHLPIYKAAYDLFTESLQITKTFPRDYRYTLGGHFHNTSIEILKLVYRTNSARDKTEILSVLILAINEMGFLIRAAHDLRILSDNRFLSMIEKRDNMEKQASGWLKSFGNNNAGISSSERDESARTLSRRQQFASVKNVNEIQRNFFEPES